MNSDRMPSSEERPLRIVQFTDFHLLADPVRTMMGINTDESFRAVLAAVRQGHWPADLCLLTGDLAQEARPETYQRLKRYLQEMQAPCHCLPGNHDDPRLMRDHLSGGNVFTCFDVAFDHWRIVFLNSTIPGDPGGFLADEELERLQASLASCPERFVLVALHHSPVETGSKWLDTMRLANADRFLALLARYPKVRLVVFGHVHQAMDRHVGAIRLLSTPSTCFQFKPANGDFALDALPPGYRWIELCPNGHVDTGVVRLPELPSGLDMTSAGY
jgi:Icc protein